MPALAGSDENGFRKLGKWLRGRNRIGGRHAHCDMEQMMERKPFAPENLALNPSPRLSAIVCPPKAVIEFDTEEVFP